MRNIRENLFFAFVYNAAGIPLAAGVLYPFLGWQLSPIVAAAAMALSSLSVVTNANRLRTYNTSALASIGPGSSAGASRIEVNETIEGGTSMPTVKDPVCGMQIDPDTAHASEEYEGTTYHFCSASCHERFKADPERFVSAAK